MRCPGETSLRPALAVTPSLWLALLLVPVVRALSDSASDSELNIYLHGYNKVACHAYWTIAPSPRVCDHPMGCSNLENGRG